MKPSLQSKLLRLIPVLVASLGLYALAGWGLGIPTLANFGAPGVPMAPSTAILFVGFAAALWLCARGAARRSGARVGIAISAAGGVIALVLLVLSSRGVLPEVEHLGILTAHVANSPPIGHMSPVTAFSFLLVALSQLAGNLPGVHRQRLSIASQWLSGLLLALSVFTALGYVVGSLALYPTTFIPPAAPTTTAFLLLAISLLGADTGSHASPHQAETSTDDSGRRFVALVALAAAGVATGGRLYYQSYARHFRAAVEAELSAVATLKVGELTNWRAERIADATVFVDNAVFAALVRRWYEHPADWQAEATLRNWLASMQSAYLYDRVFLLDNEGRRRLSAPATDEPVEEVIRQSALAARRSGRVEVVDFYRNGAAHPIHLAILAPLRDAETHEELGSLVLRVDPSVYLFPFVSHWPVPSRTAETLLTRRDGNDALYLNALRFAPDAALTLRFPLTRTDMPAVQAALGRVGAMEGLDYRGAPVVAAVRAVPNSPWALVARMDVEEVYAPLQERLWMTIVVLGTVVVAATTIVAELRRRQRRARWLAALEGELAQARLLRLFYDLPFIGMARVAPDTTHFLQFNDRLCEIVGYARDALWTRGWAEITHPDDRDTNAERLAGVARGEAEGFTAEQRFVRADGATVLASVDCKGVRRPDGAVDYLLVMVHDITERKRAELQLQLAIANLERSNRDLEQFAYIASHDLQEPLRMVSSYTQLLAQRYEAQLDDKGHKYIRYAVDGAQRMHALINDLLAYSRVGTQGHPLVPTDANAALRAATHNLAALIAEQHARITGDDLPTVTADATQLVLLFQNLLSNAIKFRRAEPPRIRVSARLRDGEWLFSLADNGIGIESQHAQRVFAIFQRLHTREEYPGTGIGLAVCQRVVERLGGRIWFESAPGEGTTFYFTIPANPVKPVTFNAAVPT